jgi:transposase
MICPVLYVSEEVHMKPTELRQEIRKMRFEEAYGQWTEGHLTQGEAARLLGVCDRTFRRYIDRYNENGLEGLIDLRLSQVSHRRAPVDEVMALTEKYRRRHLGWNARHFHSWYKREGGKRGYTWVKQRLQEAGLVKKGVGKGKHRKKREAMPLPGMMIHQDGSSHEWVPGHRWDLIVTMDDATNEHYDMVFVEEEGTSSSFQGVKKIIESKGLFCSFYSDRASHYWTTPKAGGKVDKTHPTQFGRALRQLGIEMIAAYSPEARGRSERAFATHQERLPKELVLAGITDMEKANTYLEQSYRPAFNKEFSRQASAEGTAFVPFLGDHLDDILCEQFERTVGNDNCVQFEGLKLQIPPDSYRMHYVKVRIRVHRYPDGRLGIFHGPRKLAEYDAKGKIRAELVNKAA